MRMAEYDVITLTKQLYMLYMSYSGSSGGGGEDSEWQCTGSTTHQSMPDWPSSPASHNTSIVISKPSNSFLDHRKVFEQISSNQEVRLIG